MKSCPNCGYVLNEDNPKFCSNCGKAFDNDNTESSREQNKQSEMICDDYKKLEETMVNSEQRKTKKWILMLVFSIAIIAVTIGILIFTHVICIQHDYLPPSCTKPMTCKYCEAEYGNSMGHVWVDATCTEPKHCENCEEIEGNASGHIKSKWMTTTEPTLLEAGEEQIICSVCEETLKEREIEKKQPDTSGATFNFTDEELIDWANSWLNGTYKIEGFGAFDLGSDILGYTVETADGENGMLLLKHNAEEEVSAIMVYFDDFVDRTALALFFGMKIDASFDYDDASLVLAKDNTYFSTSLVAMNVDIEEGFEVALVAPDDYVYQILAGTPMTTEDFYVSIENNEEKYAKYDNNMWRLISGEYGGNGRYWFYTEIPFSNIHDGLGKIKTYRGITLGKSTEEDIIIAYGQGKQYDFSEETDIFYRYLVDKDYEYDFLKNTQKILVYDYGEDCQIVMFINITGVVNCILYDGTMMYE